jgi:hypothetical protein
VLDRVRPGLRVQAEEAVEARLSRRLLVGAFIVVGLAGLLPVLQTSYATERGASIRALEQRRTELQAQLHDQEAEIAALTATDRVQREAESRLHMEPATRILYVPIDGEAPQQRLPERYVLPAPSSQADGEQPWWRDLIDLLPRP